MQVIFFRCSSDESELCSSEFSMKKMPTHRYAVWNWPRSLPYWENVGDEPQVSRPGVWSIDASLDLYSIHLGL